MYLQHKAQLSSLLSAESPDLQLCKWYKPEQNCTQVLANTANPAGQSLPPGYMCAECAGAEQTSHKTCIRAGRSPAHRCREQETRGSDKGPLSSPSPTRQSQHIVFSYADQHASHLQRMLHGLPSHREAPQGCLPPFCSASGFSSAPHVRLRPDVVKISALS